jgi:hypothetical protein
MSNTPQPKPEDNPATLKDEINSLKTQNGILKIEIQKRVHRHHIAFTEARSDCFAPRKCLCICRAVGKTYFPLGEEKRTDSK